MKASFIKHTSYAPINEMDLRENELAEKASAKGLVFGGRIYGAGYDKPAFGGNTFSVKDTLKANGAKFCGDTKTWFFDTIEAAEAAIGSI